MEVLRLELRHSVTIQRERLALTSSATSVGQTGASFKSEVSSTREAWSGVLESNEEKSSAYKGGLGASAISSMREAVAAMHRGHNRSLPVTQNISHLNLALI